MPATSSSGEVVDLPGERMSANERGEGARLFRIVQFLNRGAEIQGATADHIKDVRDLTRHSTRGKHWKR